ncbi:hypothetical protein GWI33_002792, partial [Rhynchophorus ferrugineus]
YRGNPLDPPLRSRFQARDVPAASYQVRLFVASCLLTYFPVEARIDWRSTVVAAPYFCISCRCVANEHLAHAHTHQQIVFCDRVAIVTSSKGPLVPG